MMSVPGLQQEIREFQFHLLARLRIFHDDSRLCYTQCLNLVAAASKYGLIFVSCPSGLNVIQTHKIIDLYASNNKKSVESSSYPYRNVQFPNQPTHLEVSCDNQYLAVVYIDKDSPVIKIYSVPSFASEKVLVCCEFRPSACISSLSWNPMINTMLAACLVDGSAVVFDFKNNSKSINTIPPEAQATCLCWSPKGKQIVIGSANGTLSQFKPELKIMKSIPIPPSKKFQVVSVQWLSSFQFATVYKDLEDDDKLGLYIVNTPKNESPVYINYDDICYSTKTTLRSVQYYMIHQQIWNVLLVASSTSVEVGVLGQQTDTWQHWLQEDEFRAELPLIGKGKSEETFPVGIAFDTSPQWNIKIDDTQTLPPMPLLMIMSHEGLLSLFFVVNTLNSAQNICSPPEPLPDETGIHYFKIQQSSTLPLDKNSTNIKSSDKETAQLAQTSQTQTQGIVVPNFITQGNTSLFQSSNNIQTSAFSPVTSVPSISVGSIFDTGSKTFSFPKSQVTITPVATSVVSASQPVSTPFVPMYSIPSSGGQVIPKPVVQVSTNPVDVKKNQPLSPEPVEIQILPTDDETKETLSEEDNEVILESINGEIVAFNSELEELRNYCSTVDINIGSSKEKEAMQIKIHNIEQFLKELKETTVAQQCEVNALKTSLFESFSWLEEAKSLIECSNDPHFVKLLRNKGTNPILSSKIDNIDKMLFYVRSQITHVNQKLDSEWIYTEYQNKNSKPLFKAPTTETVFQTIMTLNKVIHKQKFILDDVEGKLKKKRGKEHSSRFARIKADFSYSSSNKENDLSVLAENLHKLTVNKSSMEHSKLNNNRNITRCRNIQYSHALANDVKLNKIHEFLRNRPTKHFVSKEIFPSSGFVGKVTDSSSILSIISSLPESGVKPGGISSGKPIVTSVSSKANVSVEPRQSIVNDTQPTESRLSESIQTGIKNNVTPLGVGQVKPITLGSQQLLKTNLFGNKTSTSLETTPVPLSEKATSKTSLFTPTDKNKEIPTSSLKKVEPTIPNNAPLQTFSFSKAINATISASESTVSTKSPLSSLSNIVTGFAASVPRSSPEKSVSALSAQSDTKVKQFQFSQPDANKVSQSTGFTPTQPFISTLNTSVTTPSLFGVSASIQNKPIIAETTVSKHIVDEPNSKNIHDGESVQKPAPAKTSVLVKNTTGVESLNLSKPVFGSENRVHTSAEPAPNKSVPATNFSTNKSSQIKDLPKANLESDANSGSVVSDKTLPTQQNKSPIKTSGSIEVVSTKSQPVEVSPVNKSSVDNSKVAISTVEGSTGNDKTTTVISKSGTSPIPSVLPKTTLNAEVEILESDPSVDVVESTITVTNEGEEEVEANSMFDSLHLGTSQTKPVKNLFGGNSFGGGVDTKSDSKLEKDSSNISPFGNAIPTTTSSTSSFNFGAGGASIFGGESKPVSETAAVTTPSKSDSTFLNFGQATISTSEATTANPVKTTSSFSFSLPPSTTSTITSFSFAQAQSAVSSPVSEDKNAKINLSFGQPSTATGGSIFGGFGSTPAPTSSTSVFGTPVSTSSQSSFSFALPVTTSAQTSFFGNKTNVFGTAPTTTSNSFFGQPQTATTGSVFGQQSSSTSVFGQASPQAASSPFGSSSAFGAKPAFGQSGGSLFGQSSTGFGSPGNTSIFGGGGSVFGSANNSGSSVFQPPGGSIFGVNSSTSPGGGAFSSGGQSVSQTGFGSAPTFQNKLGGFGAAPAFGSTSPGFGSPATFGGAPAFGSPPKVFGSPTAGGFGSVPQQPTAFESLASQNTMSFGNLAQNQPSGFGSAPVFGGSTQSPPPQTGFSSPSSSFSGSSFSSWR
uniref:Nucleoporin Nup159/Nup146 N-terminal domain-containing protein n=2 Tax=Clastoptera arizonana TaxID=38151 RepID=A0A1B6DTN8_9HEMI